MVRQGGRSIWLELSRKKNVSEEMAIAVGETKLTALAIFKMKQKGSDKENLKTRGH